MQLHVKIFVFGLLACPSALMQAAESDNSAAAWTFSQCLDYAYSNNISLQRLVLDNQSDDATLEQSKAQWQPTLGFSTTQGYINYASPSENQTANVYSGSYGLNASWTVFNGNIRRNQIKRAALHASDRNPVEISQHPVCKGGYRHSTQECGGEQVSDGARRGTDEFGQAVAGGLFAD